MSVSQAQADISSAEFAEWVAYHNIDLFTINREENMLAIIASILANVNRGKGVKAYKAEDFLPVYSTRTTKRESGVEMEAKLRVLLNGNN
jgi:hypothetical protein